MAATDVGDLAKISHIVVLMLENRSFDHMLGFLSLEGGRSDVDGLEPGLSNPYGGSRFSPEPVAAGAFAAKDHDPDHSGAATGVQINGGAMDGFVEAYAAVLTGRGVSTNDARQIMHYHTAADLPVYAHLAEEFAVCDRWHSSVPGATWPNRLYAVSGRAHGSLDDKFPPLYPNTSFVRHLDAADVSWRWYSFDPATLRCVDSEYLVNPDHYHHFRFFDKATLRWTTGLADRVVIDEESSSFIQDAASPDRLPAVSWIDPNFNDLNLWGSASNDDHPPSDVLDGQELVFRAYDAIASGPNWDRTLFIVTYDEHGGFYDHVPPPGAPDDDEAMFGSYGVRVPALIVSPWIEPRSVSSTLFDHTSIIKTILKRFCAQELEQHHGVRAVLDWLREGHPHYMGKRVAEAADLGELLTRDSPRPAPARTALAGQLADRRARTARKALASPHREPPARALTDLQRGMAVAAQEMRANHGLPPGHA
jgi:phospholipase C